MERIPERIEKNEIIAFFDTKCHSRNVIIIQTRTKENKPKDVR